MTTEDGPGKQPEGRARQTFPKSLRLLSRADFLRVQGKGIKVSADPLIAMALKNGRDVTRVGLTVSSKVGNAVVRARLRRLMRELFRKRRQEWPQGLDVVLIAKSSAKDATLPVLSRAFDALAVKIPRQVK
ncbi:MAG: ribonuclease P protein component [Myxococcaceae bacterium]